MTFKDAAYANTPIDTPAGIRPKSRKSTHKDMPVKMCTGFYTYTNVHLRLFEGDSNSGSKVVATILVKKVEQKNVFVTSIPTMPVIFIYPDQLAV